MGRKSSAWRFYNVLDRTLPLLKCGIVNEPIWLESAKRFPPDFYALNKKVPRLKYPTDRLARIFEGRNPQVMHEPIFLGQDGLSKLGFIFAQRQLALMQQGKTEESAYSEVMQQMAVEREERLSAAKKLADEASSLLDARPSFLAQRSVYMSMMKWKKALDTLDWQRWESPARFALEDFILRDIMKISRQMELNMKAIDDGSYEKVMAELVRLRIALFPETDTDLSKGASVLVRRQHRDGKETATFEEELEAWRLKVEAKPRLEEWSASEKEALNTWLVDTAIDPVVLEKEVETAERELEEDKVELRKKHERWLQARIGQIDADVDPGEHDDWETVAAWAGNVTEDEVVYHSKKPDRITPAWRKAQEEEEARLSRLGEDGEERAAKDPVLDEDFESAYDARGKLGFTLDESEDNSFYPLDNDAMLNLPENLYRVFARNKFEAHLPTTFPLDDLMFRCLDKAREELFPNMIRGTEPDESHFDSEEDEEGEEEEEEEYLDDMGDMSRYEIGVDMFQKAQDEMAKQNERFGRSQERFEWQRFQRDATNPSQMEARLESVKEEGKRWKKRMREIGYDRKIFQRRSNVHTKRFVRLLVEMRKRRYTFIRDMDKKGLGAEAHFIFETLLGEHPGGRPLPTDEETMGEAMKRKEAADKLKAQRKEELMAREEKRQSRIEAKEEEMRRGGGGGGGGGGSGGGGAEVDVEAGVGGGGEVEGDKEEKEAEGEGEKDPSGET